MQSSRVLDWKSYHDPRSKLYAIRPMLASNLENKPQFWKEGIVLDQGQEGACVGFGWTAELLAEPFAPKIQPPITKATEMAQKYYKMAQKVDPWEGEEYEGTSVLAGAKVMQKEGFIEGYRWCFGIKDLRDAIISEGPVVIGIPWYQGMYSTRQSGLVDVSGDQVGGHCITVTGYHPEMEIEGQKREVFRWRNSWGNSYGIDGSGYIEFDVLNDLLKNNAEACIPVNRKDFKF